MRRKWEIKDARLWHWVLCPKEEHLNRDSFRTIDGKPVTNLRIHISSCERCEWACKWKWGTEGDLNERLKLAKGEWDELDKEDTEKNKS